MSRINDIETVATTVTLGLKILLELMEVMGRTTKLLQNSQGRDLNEEELMDVRVRAEAARSAWLAELEKLRS